MNQSGSITYYMARGMIEIRFHGRGGQGAVTAVTILGKAIGYDNKYSQAFGAFGPERRGAPVKAFCRTDSAPITIRSQVYTPDYVVVLDPSLMGLPEISEGLKPNSVIMVNSDEKITSKLSQKIHTFDATSLALRVLGKPIVNTAMLGAFAKLTGLATEGSLMKALEEVFQGKVLELNKRVVSEAYNGVKHD